MTRLSTAVCLPLQADRYDRHPLDKAWGALTREEQKRHADAEARAFYRRPCREYHNLPRRREPDAAA